MTNVRPWRLIASLSFTRLLRGSNAASFRDNDLVLTGIGTSQISLKQLKRRLEFATEFLSAKGYSSANLSSADRTDPLLGLLLALGIN
uniref:Uncharacterized protein n=1 Tax=Meloidogyne enterolobii TaxID=390850 RepID=A0A6V7UUX0_MELEN|nr:unnamed protein product [Meloidogyne enterolobii]